VRLKASYTTLHNLWEVPTAPELRPHPLRVAHRSPLLLNTLEINIYVTPLRSPSSRVYPQRNPHRAPSELTSAFPTTHTTSPEPRSSPASRDRRRCSAQATLSATTIGAAAGMVADVECHGVAREGVGVGGTTSFACAGVRVMGRSASREIRKFLREKGCEHSLVSKSGSRSAFCAPHLRRAARAGDSDVGAGAGAEGGGGRVPSTVLLDSVAVEDGIG
jgi:hypothetical protein